VHAPITTLQLAAARAWPAPICEPLGDWWLRSAEGFTGRGNSALPVGDPGLPLDDALDRVDDFYRRIGYRPAVEVPLPLRTDVRDAARRRGWIVQTTVRVQAIPLDRLIEVTPDGGEVDLLDHPSDDHLEMIRGLRGMLPPAAMHLLTGVRPVTFAELRRDGALICRARGSVTDGWLGLIGIETAADARGQGLASASIGRLARWARSHRADAAFLQVDTANTRAMRLYEYLGFRTHHTYERYAPAD
jgi:ribosomal protein S18 acetylase RimI-like enzyme